jgi:hypothetical protein
MREDPVAVERWEPGREHPDPGGSGLGARAVRQNRSLRAVAGLLLLVIAALSVLLVKLGTELTGARAELGTARLELRQANSDLATTRAQVTVLSGQLTEEREGIRRRLRGLAGRQDQLKAMVASGEAPGSGRLQRVSIDGDRVELADGSVWRVGAFDRLKTVLWTPGAAIKVLESGGTRHTHRLINLDTGEAVTADRAAG